MGEYGTSRQRDSAAESWSWSRCHRLEAEALAQVHWRHAPRDGVTRRPFRGFLDAGLPGPAGAGLWPGPAPDG